MKDDLFENGDPFADPAPPKATKPKRRSRMIGCPVSWISWVFPRISDQGKNQLAIALYLYRRCCICGSDTVTVPNNEIEEIFGIDRFAKSRALRGLERREVLWIVEPDRKLTKVRLRAWPDPPV